jgi:DNA-binding NarL/FixJ family response regulator
VLGRQDRLADEERREGRRDAQRQDRQRVDAVADADQLPRAVGYLLKDRVAHVADFLDALRRVAGGGTALDPEVVAQLLVRRRTDPIDRLTPRELQVLQLMAEGRSNNGITEALHVSPSAVEKYVSSIFAKLDRPGPTDTDHRRVLAVLRFLRG